MRFHFSARDVLVAATSYLEAAAWTDDVEPRWSREARVTALRAAEWFFAHVPAAVLSAWVQHTDASAGQIGHDLWLTRNGHGSGFWDRTRDLAPTVEPTLEYCRNTLTRLCKRMGPVDVERDGYAGEADLYDGFIGDSVVPVLLEVYGLSLARQSSADYADEVLFHLGRNLYIEHDGASIALLRRVLSSDADDDDDDDGVLWEVMRSWETSDPTVTVREVLDEAQPYLADAVRANAPDTEVVKAKRRW